MRRLRSSLAAAALPALVAAAGATPQALGTPAASAAAPETGLVLRYSMETLAQGVLIDGSPSSLNGRLVAGTGTARLAGSLAGYGRALELTGTQHQYVDVPT